MTVVEAWSKVMADVQAVGKDGRNTAQNYSFRGVDAVVNAVGPALRKHGVLLVPIVEDVSYRDVEVGSKRTPQRECTLRVRYMIHGPDGDTLTGLVAAEALDSGDKATAKAHSVAFRTFLLQALAIPTDEPDPDEQSYERSPQPAHEKPSPPPMSGENQGRLIAACDEKGVPVAEVVLRATNDRTSHPGDLYASEVVVTREALAAVAAEWSTFAAEVPA